MIRTLKAVALFVVLAAVAVPLFAAVAVAVALFAALEVATAS